MKIARGRSITRSISGGKTEEFEQIYISLYEVDSNMFNRSCLIQFSGASGNNADSAAMLPGSSLF